MIYLIVLLIVAAATVAVAYPLFRRIDRSGEAGTEEGSEDLRLRRERLYDALRELELEHAAGSVSREDYERIRTSYEVQAAVLLQEEEQQGKSRPRPSRRPAPAKAAPLSTRLVSRRLGLLIPAAIILVVGVGLGFFLATSLKSRQAGVGVTGEIPGGGRGAESVNSLQAANEAFNRGQFRQALEGYKRILDQDPRNVEALTQIGVILARAQHYDDAMVAFEQALRVKPDDPKALFQKGLVLFQGKVQPREGVKVWERLIETAPSDNEYAVTARRLLDQVRASMARPPSGPPIPPSGK
ncbi:MAG: c-type cytochrome biogenesis protein CcmI [Candidatus Methylomirabilales bacterium]